MIENPSQYELAKQELSELTNRLEKLSLNTPPGTKGLTKAGIRKMIAKLHEELALYEGGLEFRSAKVPQ